jgi:hypothetical protein
MLVAGAPAICVWGLAMMFEGGRSGAEAYLKSVAGRYYVYVLCRPDRQPFYVGKGINKRALEHEAEARRNHPIGESNPFKCNVIRKIIRDGGSIIYRIDAVFEPARQQDCLEREASLIAQHRRLHEGGCLTNLVGGVGNMAGAAPFSLERHADTLSGQPRDNPERAVLNGFLQGIGPVGSVPVKPVGQIARILPTTPHPQPRSPTLRCAYALVASATASGVELRPGARVPRAFSYQGVAAIIENGVARDLVKAGMAELVAGASPKDEAFELGVSQIELLIQLVGREALTQRGLL